MTSLPSRLASPSLFVSKNIPERTTPRSFRLVEIMGFEPTTYGLQSRRSSQLSYIPSYTLITDAKKRIGIERDMMFLPERSRAAALRGLPFGVPLFP